jgi:hypothetical protein
MYRHERPQTALTLAWLGGLYLAIKMDWHERPQTALTITLLGILYFAIKMDPH